VPKIKWLWRGKGADKIRYILKSGQYKMKKKELKKGMWEKNNVRIE